MYFSIVADCTEDPLPVKAMGVRSWNNLYEYGTMVTYTCSDGMTMSYAHCNGEIWSYTNTTSNCYHGTPSVRPCEIKITDPSGTISSADPMYQGCRVIISVPNSKITLLTTKFMVRMIIYAHLLSRFIFRKETYKFKKS